LETDKKYGLSTNEKAFTLAVDGILISGYGLKYDESSATGESDLIKKTPLETVEYAILTGASRELRPVHLV
jgi:magnesium-transporting ATPase (P-type)